MLKFIRRRLIYAMQGDKQKQKAVAFYLYLRCSLGDTGYVHDYSTYKLRKLISRVTTVRKLIHTDVPGSKKGSYRTKWVSQQKKVCPADSTIKKYIAILQELGLVYFDERNDGKRTLRFKKIASSTARRNMSIEGLCFKTFKEAQVSVSTLQLMLIQKSKDFVKRVIRVSQSPRYQPSKFRKEDFKKAKRLCKQYAVPDIDGRFWYDELGISYETIAKKMGVCVRTAFNKIQYAIMRHYIKKEHHFDWFKLPEGCDMVPPGATFVARGFACRVEANTYQLPDKFRKSWEDYDELYLPMSIGEVEEYKKKKEWDALFFRELWCKRMEELNTLRRMESSASALSLA